MNYRLGAGCRTSIGNGIRTRWWDREAYNVMVTRRNGNSAGRTKVTAQNVTTRPFGFFHILLFAGVIAIVLLLMPFVLAAYPLIVLSHILVFSIACLGLNLLFGTAGSFSLGHARRTMKLLSLGRESPNT